MLIRPRSAISSGSPYLSFPESKILFLKPKNWDWTWISDGKEVQKLLEQVKTLESLGFQYDQAEASFELLIRRAKPDYQPPFKLVDFMLVVEKRRRPPSRASNDDMLSEAMVKVTVGNEMIHTAAEGNGPVNALDAALRKALLQFYPQPVPGQTGGL